MQRRTFLAGTASIALTPLVAGRAWAGGKTIVVGGKDFTEELIVAQMTAELLRAHGYQVDLRTGMGSTVLHQAMISGQIDVYWEYTGTAAIVYDKIKKHLSPQETYDTVKKIDAKKGIVWLDPSRANDTFALVMNRADADKLGIHSISDLAKAIKGGKKLSFASDAEFAGRTDGLVPMERTYGFMFGRANIRLMDPGLTYEALRNHQVDVALAFSTDGRIPAFDFVVLKDDKDFFPSYALTPLVRKKVLDADPGLAGLLNSLSAKLDDATMANLNAEVDVKKKSVQSVAGDFLKSQHLV